MAKTPGPFFLPPISLDRALNLPLCRQLYDALRQGILSGSVRKGLRLPSTRYLANELHVSRNLVVVAFEQLRAEGYVESRTGAGTFVTNTLPEEVLQVQETRENGNRTLSKRSKAIMQIPQIEGRFCCGIAVTDAKLRYAPFRCGIPALNELPFDLWGRLLARHYRKASLEGALRGNPGGLLRLRDAIASYVGVVRGVRCQADQVIITNGSQQAIDLAARVLADPSEVAIIEDPGCIRTRSALQAAGLKLVPVRVGRDGLQVEMILKKRLKAKLVYVTPSHQFPQGVVLSLAKRLQLLDWAAQNDAWILEDDFDSEYCYHSSPVPAIHGLDRNGRVIYIGTFSNVLFASVRLGYLIVPKDLRDTFIATRWVLDGASPFFEQAALADFIVEGHLASRIRRTRSLYMERRSVMIRTIREQISDVLETWDSEGGTHLVAWLPPHVDDSRVCAEATKAGICAMPVSGFSIGPLTQGGLVLGFAAFTPEVISKSLRDLAFVIKKCLQAPGTSRVGEWAKQNHCLLLNSNWYAKDAGVSNL